MKKFLTEAIDYLSANLPITLTLGAVIIYLLILIHRSNMRYVYIDCKVIVKKSSGSESFYYHCTRWNSSKENGFVRNPVTNQWIKLDSRSRAIIRAANREGKRPTITLNIN